MKKTLITTIILAITVLNLLGTAGSATAAPGPMENPSQIVINEFLYNPYDSELDGEFIELLNTGLEEVDLLNWTLSDQDGGDDLVFPNITLSPGGLAVVYARCGNSTYNTTENSWYFFMNKGASFLTNTGDDILLLDQDSQPVDFISYGNGSSVDLPPSIFNHTSNLTFIDEGMSYMRGKDGWSQSLPTPGLLPDNISGILITGVCPDAKSGGEFIKLTNPTTETIDLTHCAITDGEGLAIFEKGTIIGPNQTITIAENGTRFFEITLEEPDYSYLGQARLGNLLVLKSSPKLANDGDEVFIMDAGLNIVDAFVYGDSDYSGDGWNGRAVSAGNSYQVIKRLILNDQYLDSDQAQDWDEMKVSKAGQSMQEEREFSINGNVQSFVSPDCSMNLIIEKLEGARESININVYQLTSVYLASALHDSLERGVSVNILIEGRPVGGMPDAEEQVISWLSLAGADIHLQNPPGSGSSRYRFNHAKYMTLDNQTTIIMTENWKPSGVPYPGAMGNRGWGVAIEDCDVADYYSKLFYDDWNLEWEDVGVFEPNLSWEAPVICQPDITFEPVFAPSTAAGQSIITPVVYPDMSLSANDPLLSLLDSAEETIILEQFYIDLHWGKKDAGGNKTDDNPYLQAVIDAAGRGCSVRILLDSSDYNIKFDDYNDNDDTIEYINDLAAEQGLDMEAKLARPHSHHFSKVHTKGIVVDSRFTLISSINWNENSCTRNREVGVIIDNKETASYFTGIFDHDWKENFEPPRPMIEARGIFTVNSSIEFSAFDLTSAHNIASVSWDFDSDGIEDSNMTNVTHTFSEAGQYNITLEVTDIWGNTNSTTIMVEIKAKSKAPEEFRITSESDDDIAEPESVEKSAASERPFSMGLLLLPLLVLVIIGMVGKRLKSSGE